jgi:hypothetical protein
MICILFASLISPRGHRNVTILHTTEALQKLEHPYVARVYEEHGHQTEQLPRGYGWLHPKCHNQLFFHTTIIRGFYMIWVG